MLGQKRLALFLPLIIFTLYFLFLSYFYYQRALGFGCGDDCFNYVGGYFISKGKQIYTDFFFDHHMLMAYLSFLVQKLTSPQSIYQLVLYHRLFLLFFSFLFGSLLIFRFRWIALGFLLVFESTKIYLFGNRFLAEAFIVYPIVYLAGVAYLKIKGFAPKNYDYILAGIFSWFSIFMREPYAPLVIFIFLVILVNRKSPRLKLASIGIFMLLSFAIFSQISITDYYLNVIEYNKVIGATEIAQRGGLLGTLIKSFFYPFYVFTTPGFNLLKIVEIALSAVFVTSFIQLLRLKKFLVAFFVFLALGLSNIRPEAPGFMYFQAYHMLVWYALIIFLTLMIALSEFKSNRKYLLIAFVFICITYSLISPLSFVRDKTNELEEFNVGYANEYVYGSAIKLLANPNNTLFLENTDDLIYFVADINLSYKYGWYTSFMPYIDKYSVERTAMFENNLPDFYYDACKLLKRNNFGPQFFVKINKDYSRLLINNKPSCLLVKNDKLITVTQDKWESVKPLGFSLRRTLDSGQ